MSAKTGPVSEVKITLSCMSAIKLSGSINSEFLSAIKL